MEFKVGEAVEMKKPHGCGGRQWLIKRTGADFRIQCLKCGHEVMLARSKFERAFKKRV